jgi:arylsulfatase A-like enzyme
VSLPLYVALIACHHSTTNQADMNPLADSAPDDARAGALDADATTDSDSGSGDRPANIVIILLDDLGYHDLGSYGAQFVRTPELDKLAKQSVRLTNFYVPSPVCSPSRVSVLTGRYPDRHGQLTVLASDREKMGDSDAPKEKFLGEYLRQAGYATGAFGKWQLGFADGSHPNDRGFDQFYGNPGGGVYWFDGVETNVSSMYQNKTKISPSGYATTLHVNAAIDFIRANQSKPFLVYLPLIAPHSPWASSIDKPWAPKKYLELYPGADPMRRNYKAAVSATDHEIGRLVQALDALGLTDDTLFVFYSDNGGSTQYGADNTPLRGGKAQVYEGGVRVPALIRWPGRLPGGRVIDAPLISMDIFSLALVAARLTPPSPSERIIDGRDPTDVLTGSASTLHEQLFFNYPPAAPASPSWAVRRGNMKLIGGALFDVEVDPGETTDLADRFPALVLGMTDSYQKWLADLSKSP